MSEFDFDEVIRWFRALRDRQLARRDDGILPFIVEPIAGGPSLLLDTCVYIDQFRGKLPDLLAVFTRRRQIFHSMVGVQELLHTIGRLDPSDHRTAKAVAEIRAIVKAMPSHRILTPEPDVLAKASLMAGLLCRIQHYGQDARRRVLSDCVLFLQAQKHGLTVLTRNIADFDYMLQMRPKSRVLLYRDASSEAAEH